jgi:hypothetical protein
MDRQVARRADGCGLWPLAHEVRRPERLYFGARGPSIGWMRLQAINAGAKSKAVPEPFRALKPQRTPMAAYWQARPHALCRNWVGSSRPPDDQANRRFQPSIPALAMPVAGREFCRSRARALDREVGLADLRAAPRRPRRAAPRPARTTRPRGPASHRRPSATSSRPTRPRPAPTAPGRPPRR